MEQDFVVQIANLLKHLKDKMTCPICLEVIRDVRELGCGHKFCNECFFQYKSSHKNITCPVCKSPIIRRSPIYKDEYLDHLGKFVYKLYEYLKTLSNTEVNQVLQEYTNTDNTKKCKKVPIHNSPSSSKLKNIEDSYLKVKKSPDKTIQITYDSLLLNKDGTKRIYIKKNVKTKPKYKIYSFDNSETKLSVLCWLNDTRNKFDRLTQTQNIVNAEDDKNVLNLQSVSQLKQPQNLNIYYSTRKERAKSEEIEIKKSDLPRRRTYSEISKSSDNYHIEEENTEEERILEKAEENILLDLIEMEYLKKLEQEMEITSQSKKRRKKSTSKAVKVNSINEDIIPTPNSATGWNRMTEIKKSLETSLKMPRKLNVTLNSSQSSSKCFNKRKDQKENSSLTAISNIREEQKDTSRNVNYKTNVSDTQQKGENGIIKEAKMSKGTYDLEALESYITQNILIEGIKENCADSSLPNENQDQRALYRKRDELISGTVESKKENEYDAYLAPTQKINFIEEKEESVDIITPTQKLHKDNEEIENENVNIVNFVEPALQEGADDIYFDLNNAILIEKQVKNIDSTVHLLNLLEEYLHRCNKTVKNITMLKKNLSNMDIILKKMKSVSEYHSQLEHTKNNASTQTEVKMVNQYIQTFQLSSSTETQTIKVKNTSVSTQIGANIMEKAIQTNFSELSKDSFTTKDMQSKDFSNDMKVITPNMKAALEAFVSKPEIFSMKQSDALMPLCKDIQDIKPQNEMFTCTLDNLNFSTQEILNNNVQKISSTSMNSDKIDKGESVLKCSNKCPQKLTNSQLVCTIMSTKSGNLKRRRFKEPNDSSGSDEDIKPRVKRNRFLNDDLSIEFMTSARVNSDSPQQDQKFSPSPESNSVNYDECLEQILKKYDNKVTEKIDSEDASENILKQCDKILEYTTINPTEPLNKHNTEYADIISESESLEPVPKKSKLSTFNQAIIVNSEPLPGEAAIDCKKQDKNVCDELNDSLEDINFENIEFPQEQSKPLKSHINILEDIIIKNPNLEEMYKNNEDDIFSDDDIVESTPQKNLSEKESQKSQKSKMELFPENNDTNRINEDSELDIVVLPPPPGFQDFVIEENSKGDSMHDITVIKCQLTEKRESITPDKLSSTIKKQIGEEKSHNKSHLQSLEKHNVSLSKSSLVTANKIEHSTPFSQVDVNCQSLTCISPIPKEKENLIDVLQSSTTSLINTPKRHVLKHTILSSTPKQKSIWNYVRTSQESRNDMKIKLKPCISCTRLSTSQVMSISQLTNKKLATYSSTFHKNVTHMIVAVDSDNCLKDYTAKFVAAVAAGIWVLRFDWILDSLNKNSILPEEPYEVYDDVHGTGPKTSRLTKKRNPLFKNFKFHCTNEFFSTTKKDIEDIIKMLDGELVEKPEDLVQKDCKIGLIITEGRATQDFEIYERWLELYKVATVDIEWLSRSVGRYKLLSIRPYIWCSDDYLEGLGYPEYLIENVPFSSE